MNRMMRGLEPSQQQLSSYINLEERIPADHSLRSLKVLVDSILKGMIGNLMLSLLERRPSINTAGTVIENLATPSIVHDPL